MATALGNERSRGPDIGRVWSLGFDALGRRLGEILIVAFVFGGLPAALFRVLSAHALAFFGLSVWTTLAITLGMLTITSVLGTTAGYALISRLVISTLDGDGETVARAVDNIVRRFLILIAMALLSNVGIGLATLLLIVPGLMLMTAWAIAIPVTSMERLGPIDSLRRSMMLTRGARWQIFGVILVLAIVSGGGNYLLGRAINAFYGGAGALNVALSHGWPLWHIVPTALFHGFAIAVTASIHAALYVQLRTWKDGPQSDQLAEVFA